MKARIAVFVSGRGSNLQALYAYLERAGGAEIVLVLSDRSSSAALEWARDRRIQAATLDSGADDADAILGVLRASHVDFVVLAGYLRLVPPAVVRAYRRRMVNVHPALLPAFGGSGMYGARVHRAVLDSGARVSGPTVHFVDEIYDHGEIIAQWPVPVLRGDDEASLAARVLRVEHVLLPRVVHELTAGGMGTEDARVPGPSLTTESARMVFLMSASDNEVFEDNVAGAFHS